MSWCKLNPIVKPQEMNGYSKRITETFKKALVTWGNTNNVTKRQASRMRRRNWRKAKIDTYEPERSRTIVGATPGSGAHTRLQARRWGRKSAGHDEGQVLEQKKRTRQDAAAGKATRMEKVKKQHEHGH